MSNNDVTPEQDADGYWWCPNCQAEIPGERVTYEEFHDQCGHRVEWIVGEAVSRIRALEAERDELRAEVARLQGLTICRSSAARTPILYTDTIGGKQAGVDDLWAVSTEELNRLSDATAEVARLTAALDAWRRMAGRLECALRDAGQNHAMLANAMTEEFQECAAAQGGDGRPTIEEMRGIFAAHAARKVPSANGKEAGGG